MLIQHYIESDKTFLFSFITSVFIHIVLFLIFSVLKFNIITVANKHNYSIDFIVISKSANALPSADAIVPEGKEKREEKAQSTEDRLQNTEHRTQTNSNNQQLTTNNHLQIAEPRTQNSDSQHRSTKAQDKLAIGDWQLAVENSTHENIPLNSTTQSAGNQKNIISQTSFVDSSQLVSDKHQTTNDKSTSDNNQSQGLQITESSLDRLPVSKSDTFSLYSKLVREKILAYKHYPRIAREEGIEGETTVSFSILKNGNVENIKIIKSSEHKILDTEAIRTIKRAAPFPEPPNSDRKDVPLNFKLPIGFRLNE